MAIPYGIAVGLAGVVALCLKQFSLGLAFIGASAAVEYLAVLSLKRWKRQLSSAALTSSTAGMGSVLCSLEVNQFDCAELHDSATSVSCLLAPSSSNSVSQVM